jgi:hypothetical protein
MLTAWDRNQADFRPTLAATLLQVKKTEILETTKPRAQGAPARQRPADVECSRHVDDLRYESGRGSLLGTRCARDRQCVPRARY